MTRSERTARQRVIARALPAPRRWAPGIALGALADFCVIGLLGLSMWLIVRAGEQPPILHLTFAIVGVRALAIGRAAFRYAERLVSHDAALAQLATLRSATFTSLVPRVPGAIESHRRGDVLATFVDDVDQLQDAPLRVRQPLIVSGLVVVLSVVLVALISPLAALVLAGMLLVTGGLAALLARRMAGAFDRELGVARAGLIDALLERVSSAEVLAAFGALGAQRARLTAAESRLSRVQLRRARSVGLTGAVLTLGSGFVTLIVFLVLLPDLGVGVTAPLFAAIVIVPTAIFEVFAQVPAALAARRAVETSADRVAALTETPLPREIAVDGPEVSAEALSLEALSAGGPLIEVQDLAVRHPGADVDAVAGINFSVAAGATLVITGESGSGKSTLALALARLLAYQGSYRVAGVEADRVPMAELRRVVGLCEQTPHLFDADLRQNLKFARDAASDAELMAVLDRVGLGDWARSRGGLDALVGEHGALVSGGQAQRIALARAILADFPVVVLDEPTAGVDREQADRLLRDLMGAVPDDRAVILITHTDLPAGIVAGRLELTSAR